MIQKNSEWIKFSEGVPVQLTLQKDPSSVAGKEKETDYGKKVYYYHFVDGNRAFSATEALQNKLQEYKAGDSLTITFSEKRWLISASGEPKSSYQNSQLGNGEALVILRQLVQDVKEIKDHIFGVKEKDIEYPPDIVEF